MIQAWGALVFGYCYPKSSSAVGLSYTRNSTNVENRLTTCKGVNYKIMGWVVCWKRTSKPAPSQPINGVRTGFEPATCFSMSHQLARTNTKYTTRPTRMQGLNRFHPKSITQHRPRIHLPYDGGNKSPMHPHGPIPRHRPRLVGYELAPP